ncbi:hypothetical protein A7C99_6844 [Trichophyton rubrum]|uniref:Uncharacterized protein n=1 Tax=Trichophyton rubrum TaxID=5551 RepID=A0A178ER27_TRIRU|nr:hypothetical protein A7C99_6844 [Trichophyton rubrum]
MAARSPAHNACAAIVDISNTCITARRNAPLQSVTRCVKPEPNYAWTLVRISLGLIDNPHLKNLQNFLGVPPNFRRRNARPESVAEEDAEVQQFPTNIPGVPGLPSLPIPSVPLPSWVPTAIPTGLPTGLPNIPVPTAIPTFVPTAIPTLIPTAIPTVIPPIPSLPSIPGLPSLPRLPSIPGIPPIPTPAANEKTNQAKATPNSRVMRVKQEA